MANLTRFRLLGATALAFTLMSSLNSTLQLNGLTYEWHSSDRALAQSSGGRFRGGSLDEPPPETDSYDSAPVEPGYVDPYSDVPPYSSRPYQPPSHYPRTYPPDYYPRDNPPVIVVPQDEPYYDSYPDSYGGGYYSTGGGGSLLLLLLLGAGIALPLLMTFLQFVSRGTRSSGFSSAGGELQNDIITVSKLQVVLLAQARQIQEQLNIIASNTNTNTRQGLTEVLRETVLALLRSPENWTHVRANSQTVSSRQDASRLFEQLSIEERSKFNAETLVNVGGRIHRQSARIDPNDDPAAYIVVTLLIGTADDRPLFDQTIYSAEELKTTLQRLGAISPEYLLIFELLWTPQDPADSLSYDELLTHYPDLVQIA